MSVGGEQVSGEYLTKKVIRDDDWFPTNNGGWIDDAAGTLDVFLNS
jgi:hypothetical protein